MAQFAYQALTGSGRLMKGTLEAGSQDEAAEQLTDMALQVNTLERIPTDAGIGAMGRQGFLLFNQQLASIAKAGIPLERALRELSQDIASPKMRHLIADIATDLESGTAIDVVFQKHQHQFPPLYGHLLKAGVESGQLSKMLMSLNRQVELNGQTRRIIWEAVTYPALVLFFIALVTTFIFHWIVPMLASVLHEMVGGQLNPISSFFIQMAKHIIPFWLTILVLIGGAIFFLMSLARSAAGRRLRESLIFRIPLLGSLYRASILARLAEALGVTVATGTPLSDGFRLAAYATASDSLVAECENVAGHLEAGKALLEVGAFCYTLPRLFLYSIQLGSQRQELSENLASLAQMYTTQAEQGQRQLQAVLLPLLIVFVGGILAFTILAMFLPMIQVLTSLGGG